MALPSVFGVGEVRTLRLEAACGLLALLCVLLAGLLLWDRAAGLPICYGTASVAPGLVVPNQVPDAYARALAEQIVLVLYNTTPATAGAAHARVAALFHPHLLSVFRIRAARERELMQEHDLSTQLTIRETLVGRAGGGPAVRIEALRRVFAGALPIRDEELGAVLRFQRAQPSPINPWGLVLVGLEFTEPLRAEVD